MVSSLGHVDDAIALYSYAIKLWPVNADLYCDRAGQYRIRSADRQKAIADYQEAIRLAPQSDRLHLGLGYLYSSEKNFAAAVNAFSTAAELCPKAQTYRDRGIAYRELGDYHSAIADFSRAIELKHDDCTSYYQRGFCYKAKGEPEKAAEDERRYHNQPVSHSHGQN